MSTIDKLKQAQMQRTGEYSQTFEKGTVPEGAGSLSSLRHCEAPSADRHCEEPRRGDVAISTNTNWLIGLILFILIVFNLGFTFKLFLMIKDYNSKGNNSQEKLSLVGKIVTDHANKIDNISSGLNQLEKQTNSQSVTIEKLIKSNNALFGRINSLESKLDQILKQNK